MLSITLDEISRLRLYSQRLQPKAAGTDVTQLVTALCAIQAQDRLAAELALQPRSSGLSVADVQVALEEKRSIVRTWAMRGTLHLLAAEDVVWLLPLLGPLFIRKNRRRYTELGLDEATLAKAMKAIGRVLGDEGPLTRAELASRLAALGIPTAGQAIAHLVGRAALEGLICLGPNTGSDQTYVLLSNWLGKPLVKVEQKTAQARLARRYLEAYGPAGPEDFASWSGLGVAEARSAFELNAEHLVEVTAGDSPFYLLKEYLGQLDEPAGGEPVARLLPAYDSYLLGYRDRALILAEQYARRVHPGGGLIRPALLVDGRVAGTWRLRKQRQGIAVSVELFEMPNVAAAQSLGREILDLGRYMGLEANVSIEFRSP